MSRTTVSIFAIVATVTACAVSTEPAPPEGKTQEPERFNYVIECDSCCALGGTWSGGYCCWYEKGAKLCTNRPEDIKKSTIGSPGVLDPGH